MVLDAEQNWAESLVDTLDDPHQFAHEMSPGQRGSLRALVAHLSDAENAEGITLVMRAGVTGVLTARLATTANPRVRLAPFVAVARGIFPAAVGEYSGVTFTLRFTL